MNLDTNAYARIIDNLHDGLYFVDANRIITYWNKAAERISGFTAAEVVGKSCANNITSGGTTPLYYRIFIHHS